MATTHAKPMEYPSGSDVPMYRQSSPYSSLKSDGSEANILLSGSRPFLAAQWDDFSSTADDLGYGSDNIVSEDSPFPMAGSSVDTSSNIMGDPAYAKQQIRLPDPLSFDAEPNEAEFGEQLYSNSYNTMKSLY
ncbi:hypothetical protein H4R34_003826 [Dimargaris verticillata]|uniref:Uncharacterized protein n=1 Tax=Dimargaris verticillata TaxID=2761393 RepID=A0A9W8B649_9FUNG|nr:hypothetical protein H4R34_003826 [Dimargaris verticillata]